MIHKTDKDDDMLNIGRLGVRARTKPTTKTNRAALKRKREISISSDEEEPSRYITAAAGVLAKDQPRQSASEIDGNAVVRIKAESSAGSVHGRDASSETSDLGEDSDDSDDDIAFLGGTTTNGGHAFRLATHGSHATVDKRSPVINIGSSSSSSDDSSSADSDSDTDTPVPEAAISQPSVRDQSRNPCEQGYSHPHRSLMAVNMDLPDFEPVPIKRETVDAVLVTKTPSSDSEDTGSSSDSDGGDLGELFARPANRTMAHKLAQQPSFTVPVDIKPPRVVSPSHGRMTRGSALVQDDQVDDQSDDGDEQEACQISQLATSSSAAGIETGGIYHNISRKLETSIRPQIIRSGRQNLKRQGLKLGLRDHDNAIRGLTRAQAVGLARQHMAVDARIDPADILLQSLRSKMSKVDCSEDASTIHKALNVNRLMYYLTMYMQKDIALR
jgi:hypothetical protein